MAISLDTSTEFGLRVQNQLESEHEIWLTVVNAKNEPTATLVWFLWHDGDILLLSEPNVGKVKAIRNNQNVVLHFNSGPSGTNMIVLNGKAELLETSAREAIPDTYLEKYREDMAHMEMTEEKMFAQYSQPVRVVLERLRGH